MLLLAIRKITHLRDYEMKSRREVATEDNTADTLLRYFCICAVK